jgi:pentatricopeptide repeat protein
MLQGFAMHGHGDEALEHFEHMCEEGIEVHSVAFICLLSACSHSGLVDEGLGYFDLWAQFMAYVQQLNTTPA